MVVLSQFLVVIITLFDHVRASCYLRNGIASTLSGLRICGNVTHTCCWAGQKCGSNLLCSDGPKLSREFCDNKEWHGCSQLGAEVLRTGIALYECGTNLFCYNNTACCTNGDPVYYVDPMTGDIQNATGAKVSKASPDWWDPYLSSDDAPHDTPIVTLVAIGTGGAVAGIGLGVLTWKLLFRRKRRDWAQRLAKAREEYSNHESKTEPRSTINQRRIGEYMRQELDSQPRRIQELDPRPSRIQELDPRPKKLQELP